MNIKFLKPEFPPIYTYFLDLLKINRNKQFSNNGEYVQKFENKLQEFLKSDNKPICVANATVGLTIALKSLNLKPGGVIYTTSFTFPATVQVIKDAGLVPVYVDIEPGDLTMDYKDLCKKIEKHGTKNCAIMPVAAFGGWVNWKCVNALGIPTIVDAAGAIGKYYEPHAYATVYSFHATKCLPVGEGGCIVFKDKNKSNWARSAIDFGFNSARHVMQWGLNGKMSEYEAAIGLQSLKRLEKVLQKRKDIKNFYHTEVFGRDNQKIKVVWNGACQIMTIVCVSEDYKNLLKYHLQSNGIEVREYYNPPCHLQEFLADKNADVPVTEDISKRVISLPLYSSLTEKELDYIKKVVNDWNY